MRCLVTGGLGFIGSHISERLINDGHSVVILDNFSNTRVSYHDNFENKAKLIYGDVLDFNLCLQASKDIDVVFHNAAIASIGESMEKPLKSLRTNTEGTLNLLQAAVQTKIKRFIFSSSAKIYGNSKIFPLSESYAPNLLSPYALSKFTAEGYCKFFSERFGLEIISLRHFSVYGPRQSLKNGFIGIAIENILNDKEPIFYCEPSFSRDFTYVEDVVEANILAAELKNVRFEVFNTGTGKEFSISEMSNYINKIVGKDKKSKFLPPLTGTIHRTLSNTSKARNILNYLPKTNFEDGLKKTIEWYKTDKAIDKGESIYINA